MKIVLYLSGRTGRTARFHREEDSVAGSVAIPKVLKASFVHLLLDLGLVEDAAELKTPKGGVVPHVDAGAMADAFSDVRDNGPADELYPLAEGILQLCESEASCGVLHVVGGDA